MNRDLPIQYLRTLIAIAEEEGFEAAAKRVARTQSAVTQQMQKLEEIVGKPLFAQDGRARVLNDSGRVLVRYAREIISISTFAVDAANSESRVGLVRIAVPHEMSRHLLPDVLKTFARQWPDIRIIVYVERSPIVMTMLQERRVDLAVTTRHSTLYSGCKFQSVPAVWLAASDFDWDPDQPLPIILTDEPSIFRRIALTALDVAGIPYIERMTSQSLVGIQPAIESGLGITVRIRSAFPPSVVTLGEDRGLPPLPSINYFAYMAPGDHTPYARDLFSLITDAS